MKRKILADFQIRISVPLIKKLTKGISEVRNGTRLDRCKINDNKAISKCYLDCLTRFADFLLKTYVGNLKS